MSTNTSKPAHAFLNIHVHVQSAALTVILSRSDTPVVITIYGARETGRPDNRVVYKLLEGSIPLMNMKGIVYVCE